MGRRHNATRVAGAATQTALFSNDKPHTARAAKRHAAARLMNHPEEARLAGRKGGEAAHRRGTAHEFTPEEARVAGRKGGRARRSGQKSSTSEPPGEQVA
jgi:general stress protein YciG